MRVFVFDAYKDTREKRINLWRRFPNVSAGGYASFEQAEEQVPEEEDGLLVEIGDGIAPQPVLRSTGRRTAVVWNTVDRTGFEIAELRERDNRGVHYFCNSIIYSPPFLELKRVCKEQRFGELRSAELTVRYGNRSLFRTIGEALFWMFSHPETVRVDNINRDTDRIILTCSNDLSPWAVSATCVFTGNKSDQQGMGGGPPRTTADGSDEDASISVWGVFIFEKAAVTIDSKEKTCIFAEPAEGEPYPLVLPEGSGEYYNILDILESFNEKRSSSIFSYRSAVSISARLDRNGI